MAEPLFIFGSGGHAKVVLEAVLARTPDREVVLLDDDPNAAERRVLGLQVRAGRDCLDEFPNAPVALGIGHNDARARLMEWLGERSRQLETVVHPSATVGASVDIGPGAFIAAGAILIAEARIGAGAIVNTAATIDHDCVIREAAHIGPGSNLCGNVRIGARTLVGVASAIRPGVSVCDDVVLGAGSVVVRDIDEPGVFVGNPARRQG
jgi:sugar O-acyltransferase (sialic acid O-acetyltransferase NeuD family)